MAEPRRTGSREKQKGPGTLFYALLGLVAVGGVAWLLLARGGGASELPTPAEFEALYAEVEADPSVGIPLGDPDAPVTIEEFADYSCPHCAQFGTFTGRLLRQNYVEGGGPVRWVLYDYVLGTFPHSAPAAVAARCAGDQDAYWPMHDMLLARQREWAAPGSDPQRRFGEFAERIGLDVAAFRSCLGEGRHIEEVAASRKLGAQRGVNSTPTLFLNGRELDLRTEGSYEPLERLIQRAADSVRAARSGGEAGSAGGEAAADEGGA